MRRKAIDMPRIVRLCRALTICTLAALHPATATEGGPRSAYADRDWRNIRNGHEIPSAGYCDQPYVVTTKDGNWLCTLTTGAGVEGQGGQHVAATISTDKGRTWSPLIDIEPATGPEASWAMPLLTPFGRVYVFYSYNGDRIHTLGDKQDIRADMLGWYCYRYSEDHGRTWSAQRYRLPLRETAVDRTNDWNGKVQIFWGIGKPIVARKQAFFGFTKVGKYMLENSEGWFFASDNILTERNPELLHWEMLPEGDHGVRNPDMGSVQEEHNLVPMSRNSLYCIYRTTQGYPCESYSRDGGKTWSLPEFVRYASGDRRIKTPRACPRIWKTKNRKYLLWFHNHSGRDFQDRNPAWLCGGIEANGRIQWSQPEIVLYDPGDDRGQEEAIRDVRISYPDLIEERGKYWITETQKETARVHAIDPALLKGLWKQGKRRAVARDGCILSIGDRDISPKPPRIDLPDWTSAAGFTIEFWFETGDLTNAIPLLEAEGAASGGISLALTAGKAIRLELSDGSVTAHADSDPLDGSKGQLHHVVAIVDNGPKIALFLVDGLLSDGGDSRQFGWTRYPAAFTGAAQRLSLNASGHVRHLRVYNRPLRTSEAVSNYRAGL